MADDFRTYDKAPIVGVVSISKWSFGLREIILAGIGILLLIMCLIFAGLFGHAEKKLADGTPSASAVVGQTYCVDISCLNTASRALSLMNMSVDPCEDFYQYACGNYKNAKTISEDRDSRTVLSDLSMINQERLTQIMDKPIQRMTDWASERKLKEFFQSCNDMFIREKLLGTPFLQRVVPALGGWDLLGTWDEANWDFNTALKKVSSDFFVSALFTAIVTYDYYDWTKYVIELRPGGMGKWMYSSWYTNPHTQRYRDDYQAFIRRVGSLFMRDAKLSMDADTQAAKLDQFVNDTFMIESKIADIYGRSRYRNDPYQEHNKASLSELNTETDNVINWIDQFTYMFPGARISGSTKIVLMRREYFQNMTRMISNLPDQDRKRMLHHYLMWRVAEIYVQDLSWEYIHANREIYVDIYGVPAFSGVYRYCFSEVSYYMRDALGSLFISNHFTDTHKKQVHDITDNLKKALEEQLEKTPWMDAPTKAIAKDKLSRTIFKLGYPDWMANHDAVDSLYIALSVNISDFFGNIVNANKFIRSTWSNDLLHGENRHEWLLQTYATNMGVYWFWNEIITPAGILQSPIFDYKQPHFSTFGSLGTLMGRFLHHVVDSWGQHYDSEGNYVDEGWWTNKSLSLYKPVEDCVTNVYENASTNVVFPDGSSRYVRINAKAYSPKAISIINGIRLSMKGYRKWVSERGISEKMLPGISLTDAQMLFLSHAQTFCYDRSQFASLIYAFRGNLEEDLQVNIALGQLKEFSDTFQCKPTAKMNNPNKCDYY